MYFVICALSPLFHPLDIVSCTNTQFYYLERLSTPNTKAEPARADFAISSSVVTCLNQHLINTSKEKHQGMFIDDAS